MDYDKLLANIFFKDDKLNLSTRIKFNKLKKKKYSNIKHYLCDRYRDSASERETLYRIYYGIEVAPVCSVCGKRVNFSGKGGVLFLSHCSHKCKKLDKSVNEKWRASCGENGTNREKAKQTTLERYGYENPYQIPEIVDKIRKINIEKKDTAQAKLKQTCLEKYGVEHYTQTKEFKQKVKQTSLEKYGTEHPMQSDIVKSKYDRISLVEKINKTKHKNHTFNTSKDEDYCYEILLNKFKDVKRQYKCEKYPFNCDFYIPEIDTFIECQFSWVHHTHPFNENNLSDLNILSIWMNKPGKYYKTAASIWTIRDVNKRNAAKENNLNYKEFWTVEELKEWVENYEL